MPGVPRVLARVDGARPGPLLLAVCGIHGNEPAGGRAAARLAATLRAEREAFRGRFVAVAGNAAALERDVRYLASDLNRRWLHADVAEVRARAHGGVPPADPEEREQRALLDAFDAALGEADGPVVVCDLHSFSSHGAPFIVTHDAPTSIAFAAAAHLPTIVNLERYIRGTILEYFIEHGLPIIGVEAGRHADPRTVAFHESTMLVALVEMGALPATRVGDLAARRAGLVRASVGLPALVDVVHRHAIAHGDDFVMRPGFRNFDPVYREQVLADDRHGPIKAGIDGWLLMPLYQGQGADGFFIALER